MTRITEIIQTSGLPKQVIYRVFRFLRSNHRINRFYWLTKSLNRLYICTLSDLMKIFQGHENPLPVRA
jgi:hypothetical protein